jgi:hypothetical protein
MKNAFRHMISMELDDDDKLDAPSIANTKPDFPYGLRISLTETEFEKLGLDPTDAEVGAIFHGHFLARVTSVSSHSHGEGDCHRVEAQIEDLEIESEDEEDREEGEDRYPLRR